MKKRDLFLTGFMMLALPASVMAQVTETTVVRTKDDAKVMFEQRFEASEGKDAEAAWQEWSTTPVDTMYSLTYIGHVGSESNLAIYGADSAKYKMRFVKDSTIYMLNGVMTTDDAGDIKKGYFDADDYTLVFDDGKDVERNEVFESYGENGGKYYFQYWSDNAKGSANYDNTNSRTPNYRRNLFVRGIDVEENSSYRFTAYVKVNPKGTAKPTFYADVMRGYFHSEKPFTMGYVNDNDHLQYNTEFVFSKEDFENDKWEKVTFMTYYLNDSIADGYCYTQYWWAGGSEWSFRPSDDALAAAGLELKAGDSLKHVIQPDKFFVRLSFASDSAYFSVDNISLTKSWIGGVEYHNDMIRVDFGYETNLKQLAIDAGKNSFVNAIELGGEYFDVIGYRSANGKYYNIPINSAEYHDDGYMYMWTKPSYQGGKYIVNKFDVYDSIFVSFRNPDTKELRLNYSGSKFPMALDTAWIKAGKKVHDFSNEIATPNPNIGKGVYSMKNLPPVITALEYEKGSFQLDGTINEMRFEFSRPVTIDPAAGASSAEALLMVEKNGVKEFWIPSATEAGADADSVLVFKRQAADISKNPRLDGDYVFTLANIRGYGTDYAQNTSIDYSFGETVMATPLASVTFDDYDDGSYTTDLSTLGIEGISGFRCAAKIKSFSGLYEKALMWGLYGVSTGAEPDATSAKSCNLYYTFEVEEDGPVALAFGVTGCNKSSWNDDANMTVFIYDANNKEMAKQENGGSGIKVDEGGNVEAVKEYTIAANLPAGTYKLALSLPNEGSWGGGHQGGKVLYYINIQSNFTNGYPYVNSLNNAIEAIEANFELVNDEPYKYSGAAYDSTFKVYDQYVSFTDTKPSRYTAVTDSLNKANDVLKARLKVVDGMWNEYNALESKLEVYADSISDADGVEYNLTAAYLAAEQLLADNADYECWDKTDAQIDSVKNLFINAGKALDARKALTDSYFTTMDAADAILSDDGSLKTIDEFEALMFAYDAASLISDNNQVETISDEDFKSSIDDVSNAIKAYNGYIAAAAATTVRLKALAELAEKVEADFGEESTIIEQAKSAAFDNDGLAEILMSGIKVAIYKDLAAGTGESEYDFTSFIKNYNLYATIGDVIDLSSKELPGARNDAALKGANNPGYQIMKVGHQWGQDKLGKNCWVLLLDQDYDDVFPGWTVKSYITGSHSMVTPDPTATQDYSYLSEGMSIFDGAVTMDWNSKAELKTSLEDLPTGTYNLGVTLVNVDASSSVQTSLTVAAGDTTITYTRTEDGSNIAAACNEIPVTDGKMSIDLILASNDGGSKADDFTLTFIPSDTFNYGDLVAEEQAKLNNLILFVDGQEVAPASVEYTTLSGIPVTAPQAGQILIQTVTFADGTVENKTVIIK
ncbi:MAG: hypothetical protein J6Y51_00415 [Bacteroidaceae bacterium]|nr:hypothetical protein [Bacteroidaceae bacterium]